MALPNLWNEGGFGAVLIDLLEQLNPINFAIQNLQAFSIDILGIRQVEVGRERQDFIKKLAEWHMQVIAGQL